MQTSIFSVDVEDWFHILDVPSVPNISEWSGLPSHVEKNFTRMLDMFSEEKVQVTCFFLGWIAEHYPQLVKEAAARGHEIASHGYGHRLVYEQGRDDFYADVRRARCCWKILPAYRSAAIALPDFSTTEIRPGFSMC